MQWILNNLQLVVILLVVFGPIIQGILKALADSAKKRRELAEQRQREDEALRTGRLEPSQIAGSPTPVGLSREAELEELRRRARQRRDGSSPAPAEFEPRAEPVDQSKTIEVLLGLPPGSIATDEPDPERQRREKREARRRQRQAEEARRKEQEARRQQAARIEAAKAEVERVEAAREHAVRQDRLAAWAQPTSFAVRPAGKASLPGTRRSWREAFILNEILRPPVGFRPQEDRGVF